MKRWLLVLGVLLAVLAVLIAALPRLASTGWVRSKVLAAANERAPGTADVGDWRLRWFGGQTLSDIVYEQEDGTSVRVAEVRVDHGLLALARNPYDFGRVEIVRPDVMIALPAERAPDAPPPEDEAPPSVPREPTPAVELPDLRGALVIVDGRVSVVQAGAEPVQAANDLNFTAELSGRSEPIRLDAALAGGAAGGAVSLTGTVNPGATLVVSGIRPDLVLEIRDLDLESVSALLPAEVGVSASGTVAATVSVSGTLADGLRVVVAMAIPGLALAGDALKGDTPRLGDLVLNLDAVAAQDRLMVSNLMFQTDFATVTAGGQAGTDADGTLTLDAAIDVAAALSQFPRTVGLQEGMRLEEGLVTVHVGVTRAGEQVRFEGNAEMERLRGVRDGQVLSWDSPSSVDLAGTLLGGAVALERLRVQSPLLSAEGSGSMDDLTISANADVASALAEARKFVALEGWDAGGTLTLNVRATAGQADWRQVEGSLMAADARLARDGEEWIPRGPIRLQWAGDVRAPDASRGLTLRNAAADFEAWLGTGSVSVEEVVMPAAAETGALPSVTGAEESIQVDLAKVSSLLRVLGLLDAEMALSGAATVAGKLSVHDGLLEASDVAVDLDEFVFRQGDKEMRDAAIRLRASASLDPERSRVQVPEAILTMGAGTLRAEGVDIQGGSNAGEPPSVTARVDSRMELDTLLAALGGFAPIPESTQMAGNAAVQIDLSAPGGEASRLDLSAELEEFTVDSTGGTSFREERIHLAGLVLLDTAAGTAVLESFSLTSSPVNLSANAIFSRQEERVDLAADGQLGLDLARVGDLANAWLGTDLVLEGKDQHPFRLVSYLTGQEGENILTQTEFSAGLSADVIRAFGLDIRDLAVPVGLSNGVASAAIDAGVNEGRIHLRPVVDFNQEMTSLVLVQPTNLLAGVHLTEALANELLAHLHPMFKGATGLSGSIDLGMDEFVWPLDAASRSQARFNGVMTFHDLQLQTSGLLEHVLEAAKVRERGMQVDTREIRFTCRDGRVEASPMQLNVKGHDLVLAGSMGLDQTLDYSAQIPVTEDLVGKQVYPYLADTTLRLPIRGTVADPALGMNVLQEAIGDLSRQALRNAAQRTIEEKAGSLLEGLFR